MQCSHPISSQFCQSLPDAVLCHCNNYGAPKRFTYTIVEAIQDWLDGQSILQSQETLVWTHPYIAARSSIEWDAFLKGFISWCWRILLTSKTAQQSHGSSKLLNIPTFLLTLIQLIWLDAYDSVMNASLGPCPHPKRIWTISWQDRQMENQKNCMLHNRRNDTLAVHCHQYFHEHLKVYLATATGAQMQTYLLTYSPAIYARSKEASKINNANSVLNFAGFTRLSVAQTPARNPSTNVWSENPIPHKHSRWQPPIAVIDRFLNYFQQPDPLPQSSHIQTRRIRKDISLWAVSASVLAFPRGLH